MKLSKHHNAPPSLLNMQIINLRLLVVHQHPLIWLVLMCGIGIDNWQGLEVLAWLFLSYPLGSPLYSLWSPARLPTKLAKLTMVNSIWRSNRDKFRRVYNLLFKLIRSDAVLLVNWSWDARLGLLLIISFPIPRFLSTCWWSCHLMKYIHRCRYLLISQ